MESLVELYCAVDDFCQVFRPVMEAHMLSSGMRKCRRARSLIISEVMTILINSH